MDTLIILCPVCSSDAGDTLGVTGAMYGSSATSVVIRCEHCATVYLSPAPHGPNTASGSDIRLGAFKRHMPRLRRTDSRYTTFVATGDVGDALISDVASARRYDRIFLPFMLESSVDPKVIARNAADLLEDRGWVEIIAANADSSCFRRFGGRHWCGYRFPTVRQQFATKSFEVLARDAKLRIVDIHTRAAPSSWLHSLRNLLNDWGANRLLTGFFTGPWIFPWLVAALAEAIALLRNRGSVIVVRLEKA